MFYFIIVFVWISPEILNIVSIDTNRSVVRKSVWTPYSLVLLQIEIVISVEQVNHFYFYFGLIMSKGTKLSKIASDILISVSFAKFRFVSVGMINLLDFVMRVMTVFIVAFDISAKLMAIGIEICSSSIRFIMIINASFSLMKII